MTTSEFKEELKNLLDNNKTKYIHTYKEYDTSEFIKEFLIRFNYNKSIYYNAAKKINLTLITVIPFKYIQAIIIKIINKILLKIKLEINNERD